MVIVIKNIHGLLSVLVDDVYLFFFNQNKLLKTIEWEHMYL